MGAGEPTAHRDAVVLLDQVLHGESEVQEGLTVGRDQVLKGPPVGGPGAPAIVERHGSEL
jgi:hypothetical protein